MPLRHCRRPLVANSPQHPPSSWRKGVARSGWVPQACLHPGLEQRGDTLSGPAEVELSTVGTVFAGLGNERSSACAREAGSGMERNGHAGNRQAYAKGRRRHGPVNWINLKYSDPTMMIEADMVMNACLLPFDHLEITFLTPVIYSSRMIKLDGNGCTR